MGKLSVTWPSTRFKTHNARGLASFQQWWGKVVAELIAAGGLPLTNTNEESPPVDKAALIAQ